MQSSAAVEYDDVHGKRVAQKLATLEILLVFLNARFYMRKGQIAVQAVHDSIHSSESLLIQPGESAGRNSEAVNVKQLLGTVALHVCLTDAALHSAS